LFPAQKYFPAADDGREVNQAAFDILDLDLPLLEFGQNLLHLRQLASDEK